MIFDLFTLAVLVAEVVVLSRLDYRRFGTWATPFTVLGYPFVAVAVVTYLLAPALDFVPLYTGAVVVWIVGLFLLWAAGNFLAWGFLDMRLASNLERLRFWPESSPLDDETVLRWAVLLSWIAMPFMVYGVMASVKSVGGWEEFGSDEFRDAYAHGVHGHAVVLALLLTVVLIGLYRRGSRVLTATIVMLFMFLIVGRVKGTILQALIGGLLFRMMRGQFKVTWKRVGMVLLATYFIFNLVYFLGMTVYLSDDPFDVGIYTFLARHFMFYLFAGVLGYSEALRSGITDVGGDWHSIFAPFINVYRVICGGTFITAGSFHEKGMLTDRLWESSSDNVYTMFGTLHLYLGPLGAALYVFAVGILCYGFLILVKKRRSAWVSAGYCLTAAQFALGFFEFYFWHLTTYEVLVLGGVLAFASRQSWRLFARAQPVTS